MKTIFAYLTSLLVAANALAVFAAPDDKASQTPNESKAKTSRISPSKVSPNFTIPIGERPLQSKDVDLAPLYESLALASKNADVDALRKLVDDALPNPQIPNVVKIQLAAAYYATQIDLLGQKGDAAGLAAFCDDIVAESKKRDGAIFRAAFAESLDRVAIYAPAVADSYQKDFGRKRSRREPFPQYAYFDFAPSYVYVPLYDAEPTFDVDLFSVESGRDFEYYRDAYERFKEALERYRDQVQKYARKVAPSYESPRELEFRIDDAEIKILREKVLAQTVEVTPQLQNDATEYLLALRKRSPVVSTNPRFGLEYDEFYEKSVDELIEENIIPEYAEKFRIGVYAQALETLSRAAAVSSEADKEAFLNIYRDQLRRRPEVSKVAPNLVDVALDRKQREYAVAIADATKDALKENENDPQLIAVVGRVESELQTTTISSFVGKKIELSGIDVNFNEFDLASLRGKRVLLYLRSQNGGSSSELGAPEKKLHEYLDELGADKIEFIEYDRSIYLDPKITLSANSLDETGLKRSLETMRANPWTTVAWDLSQRANLAYDANYPDVLKNLGIRSGSVYALIDAEGVLVDFDENPQTVSRRLQLLFNGDKQENRE